MTTVAKGDDIPAEAERGPGWWRSAPGVVPPALVVGLALLVYAAVEAGVGLLIGSPRGDAGSFRT
ncbi:hypothetical protein [Blastococcus atacamensis]|uniref:hypothetical protein n=1 Tax=Blastococcus atacamensis TaxID=2070508 RepID=UPI0012FFFB08|nr:hypothetical protein [Blastococcus atacamensis]